MRKTISYNSELKIWDKVGRKIVATNRLWERILILQPKRYY